MDISRSEWLSNQKWEKDFWGDFPALDHHEVVKQDVYARLMGIQMPHDAQGKSIVDFGCGPVGMLLRTTNFSKAVGVEPLHFSDEVLDRYRQHNVKISQVPMEDFGSREVFDEAWMYNLIEHVINPVECLKVFKDSAKTLRLFEWIDLPPRKGHPHTITERMVVDTLGLQRGEWSVLNLAESGCYGRAIVVVKEAVKDDNGRL
jgi:hypothetical protein